MATRRLELVGPDRRPLEIGIMRGTLGGLADHREPGAPHRGQGIGADLERFLMLLPSVGPDGARVETPLGSTPCPTARKTSSLPFCCMSVVLSVARGCRALPATGTGAAARYMNQAGIGSMTAPGLASRWQHRRLWMYLGGSCGHICIGGNAVGGTHDMEAAMTTNDPDQQYSAGTVEDGARLTGCSRPTSAPGEEERARGRRLAPGAGLRDARGARRGRRGPAGPGDRAAR